MNTGRSTPGYGTVNTIQPSAYLLHPHPDQLNALQVYRQVVLGFFLSDVRKLLAAASQPQPQLVLSRIQGAVRPHNPQQQGRSIRLNPVQSAIALHYARVLELAIGAFGSLASAGEWIVRPCPYFNCELPLDMLTQASGYQAIRTYLLQVSYGVYP